MSSNSESMSPLAVDEIGPDAATGSVSEIFNAPGADIVFQSSDGVQFRIHKANLDACTEGFSPPEHSTFDEVAHLTEQSYILELLFQFIYPEPQPELETFQFDILFALAEAAEKYRVHPAMSFCTLLLSKRLPEHCEEILQHGLKHKIRKLVDRAASLLLDDPEDLSRKLDNCYLLPWMRYYMQCSIILTGCLSHLPDVRESHRNALRKSLETDMKKLPALSDIAFSEISDSPEWFNDVSTVEPSTTLSLLSNGDVTVISKDGVTFGLHQNNVRVCAGRLLPPGNSDLVPVVLPQTSSTLRLLFRFIYPLSHPDLENIDTSSIIQLYEAAKAYQVFTAVNLCKMYLNDAFRLSETLEKHAAAAFRYALEIRNFQLVDKSALLLITRLSLIEALKSMDPSTGIQWPIHYPGLKL
ncbi:hypothetical protein DXG01_005310 [Tephrocybe rancida]|nr:hypothetical protein DXG01_005310 [Tephrocybe rancida]